MHIPQGWFLLSSLFTKYIGYTSDGVGAKIDRTPRDLNQCTNATEIIEFIFRILNPNNYNRHKVPGHTAVTVRVEMWIQEVTTVSEITQDFVIDLYINEFWNDPSLNYQHLNPCRHNISLDQYVLQKLWTPNTCFINSKNASIHNSPFTNVFLMIFPNGTLWGNYRVKLAGPCNMDLKKFPMDTQTCFLTFESFNYNTDDVRMEWTETPIIPPSAEPIELPDFTLVRFNAVAVEQMYPAGWWDELTATFVFERRYGWYILQGYIPSYLIIFISWISFYLGVKAIPARTMIGVNSLLAMTMMFGNIIRNLPRVSYVKAIDVWMLSCMSFVFMSLLELATIGYLSRNIEIAADRLKKRARYRRSSLALLHSSLGILETCPQDLIDPDRGGRISRVKSAAIESLESRSACCKCFCDFVTITPEKIDKFSAIMFPTSFFIFNLFYWGYYLGSGGPN